jgi:hypothetical protein
MFVPLLFSAALAAAPAPLAVPTLSPRQLLGQIRRQFRSHRPPPPYETYTLERVQLTDRGFLDYAESYTYHIWARNLDRAALKRKVYRGINRGFLEFDRPAFNEARDPGPPTADVFEPAPEHPHPVEFVPTPEAKQTELPTIATVQTVGEFDYRVDSVAYEGDLVHLSISPTRDPDRNRLREVYADRTTYELRKLIARDKLFIQGGPVYGVTFTITMGWTAGLPVVTDIHSKADDNYVGDAAVLDFHFRDIAFPTSLSDWYFDSKQYAQHEKDAPL